MKNIKSLLIISIISIITLISVTSLFASNIGRHVYGIITETYKGVYIDTPSAGEDFVKLYGTPNDNYDCIEGRKSVSVGHQGWFGAVFASGTSPVVVTPRDMSAYAGGRLYFSAKVPSTVDMNTSKIETKHKGSGNKTIFFNSTNIKRVDNGSNILGTGITADNSWHTYYIELSSFTGLDLSKIEYLFIVGTTTTNNTVLIDNVRWVKPGQGSFSIDLKNIGDDSASTTITWDQSVFRQGWKAANQYVQFDIDDELPTAYLKTWKIKIYTVGGTATNNGLRPYRNGVLDTGSPNLPLCWRMIDVPLVTAPSATEHTTIIDGYYDSSYGLHLYDAGKAGGIPYWWCWLLVKDQTDDFTDDYSTIWDWRGWHAAENGVDDSGNAPFYNGAKDSPRLYFGADFTNASDFTYKANIRIEFFNE